MPINPLPTQPKPNDKQVVGKINELVAASNSYEASIHDLTARVEALESVHIPEPGEPEPEPGPEPIPPTTEPEPIPPPSGGGTGWKAERPRATVDVTYTPATGASHPVASDTDMRAALQNAQDGDEIVVTADIVGSYTIAGKRLTIRSTNLPAVGKRVTMVQAGQFPTMLTPTSSPVITAVEGASVRLAGIQFGAVDALVTAYSLIEFGRGDETSLATLPVNCIVDRCLVLGHDTLDVRRGVRLEGKSCGIVDSTIDGIHTAFDGCAVFAANGPGPIGIYNTYLGSSGENFMFGGTGACIAGTLPSDITIEGCHMKKQSAWDGSGWQLKNLGEFKVGRRALISRCIFEHNIKSTQPGYAFVLTPTDQDGTAPWSTVEDITLEWCEFIDVKGFGNMMGYTVDNDRFWLRRVSITDTLVHPLTAGLGCAVQFQRHTEGLEVARCTFVRCAAEVAWGISDYAFVFEETMKGDGGIKGVRVVDNLGACDTPFFSSTKGSQTGLEPEFDPYAPDRIITGNHFVGRDVALPTDTGKGVDRAELSRKLAGVA